MSNYASAACLVLLVLLLVFALASARAPCARPLAGRTDGFFAEHGQEEPTRAYVPYTGTVPLGHWGTRPWAEAVPLTRGGDYGCYGSVREMREAF